MIGLILLALLVVMAILVVASVGFVFVVLGTAIFKGLSKSGPFFTRMARAGGFAIAAFVMAVVSVNIVAGHQDQSPTHDAVAQVNSESAILPAAVSLLDTSPFDEVSSVAERIDSATVEDAELPNWVTKGSIVEDGVSYVVLESDLHASREDANASLIPKAAKLIAEDFAQHHSANVSWDVPQRVVEDAIRRTYLSTEENIELTTAIERDMYRVYAQVAISPSLRSAIYPGWRKLVVTQRLVKLGQGFGLVILVVMSLATYLRYDKQTLGKKKGRLGLLSLAILTTGGVAVGAIGDSIRSKLSASNIIADEYDRDQETHLDETVIGIHDQRPLIHADETSNKIAVLIENAGNLQRPDVISREMSYAIRQLSKNTTVSVHVVSDRSQSEVIFVGGQNVNDQIAKLIRSHKGMDSRFENEVQAVVSSGAQSVFVVTEGLSDLSQSGREAVLKMRSPAPVHFIKLHNGNVTRFDRALRSFSAQTGGQLRFFESCE